MTAHPVTVPASATVAWFLDDYLPWHRHSAFPVEAGDGQIVGLVRVHRVNQVPAAERGQTPLRDAACPLSDVARATPDEPVADVLPRLNACSENRALVFAGGHLAGIVSPADISRAVGVAQPRPRHTRISRLSRGRLASKASITPSTNVAMLSMTSVTGQGKQAQRACLLGCVVQAGPRQCLGPASSTS
jgi:hypothetical protein